MPEYPAWVPNGAYVSMAAAPSGSDDAPYLQTLADGGGAVQLRPGATYKLTSQGLTIDPSKSVFLGPATIDGSALTTGAVVILAGAQVIGGTKPLQLVQIDAPTTSGTTVDAIHLGGTSTYANNLTCFGVTTSGGRYAHNYDSNAYLVRFIEGSSSGFQSAGVAMAQGVTNSGENMVYDGYVLDNAAGDAISISVGEFTFRNVSFDYVMRAGQVSGTAVVKLDHCHMEGNDAGGASGANEYLYVGGSAIVTEQDTTWVTGNFTTRPHMVTVDQSGTYITDRVDLSDNNADTFDFVEDASTVTYARIKTGSFFGNANTPGLSARTSRIRNGNFSTGNVTGWTTTGAAPTVVTTPVPAGMSYAAEFNVSSAESELSQTISALPGDVATISFQYEMTAAPSTGYFVYNLDWLDQLGNVISSVYSSDFALAVAATYTRVLPAYSAMNVKVAPSGTDSAKLRIGFAPSSTGTAYIADVRLTLN